MQKFLIIFITFFFLVNNGKAQTTGIVPDSTSPTNNSALSRREGISTGGSTTSDKRKTWTPKNPQPGVKYLNRKIKRENAEHKKVHKKGYKSPPAKKDSL